MIISCRETKRSQEIAKYLVKAGADPTIAYNGRTALDFAEAISPEFHASLQGTSLLLVSCILESSNHILL